MARPRLNIAVIVGSTREGRFGPTVAKWFVDQARTRADMAIDVIDLADVDLPAVYPAAPQRRRSTPTSSASTGPTRSWSSRPSTTTATPPRSSRPSTSPTTSGGPSRWLRVLRRHGRRPRAVEQLRQVFAELHATTVRDTVSFHWPARRFDCGRPGSRRRPVHQAAAKTMLDQLAWWAAALRTARTTQPYAA